MSRSRSDPRPSNQQHISFRWERSGREAGCGWVGWFGLLLTILGIVLTIALSKGWL